MRTLWLIAGIIVLYLRHVHVLPFPIAIVLAPALVIGIGIKLAWPGGKKGE